MKVLIAGSKGAPNNFTRFIGGYEGVEFEHLSGEVWDGARVPDDADACLLVKGSISHAMCDKVKATFKKKNRPIFYCGLSTAEVREDFENFIRASGMPVLRKGQHVEPRSTTMTEAFGKAVAPKKPPEPSKEQIQFVTEGTRPVVKQVVRDIIAESLARGLKAREIAVQLNEAGWKKLSGGLITPTDVFNYSRAGKPTKASASAPAAAAAGLPPPPPSFRKEKYRPHSAMDLIGRVLKATNLSADRKTELIEEIHAGVRTTDQQVIAERREGKLQITLQSIFEDGDKPLLLLDPVTAIAVLQTMKEIKAFVEQAGG